MARGPSGPSRRKTDFSRSWTPSRIEVLYFCALRGIVEGALRGQGHARHGEHVAADRRFKIDADRRRRAQRTQAACDGMAVALAHLVLGRDRKAHAEIDEGLELGISEIVAV